MLKLSPASEVEPSPRGDGSGHMHRGLGDVPRAVALTRGRGRRPAPVSAPWGHGRPSHAGPRETGSAGQLPWEI